MSKLALPFLFASALALGASGCSSGIDAPEGFGEACATDAECGSGLVCYEFTDKGKHCTLPCGSDDDCPDGCNGKGYCKVN